MGTFKGTIDDLKAVVSSTGHRGTWTNVGPTQYRFTTEEDAVLDWWVTGKKTTRFQGPPAEKEALEAAFNAATGVREIPSAPAAPIAVKSEAKQIFVVHGHDQTAREQLELIIHRLDLHPFVLQNMAGMGMTIIEALEQQIGHAPEAEFGIVLMTPDDLGYAKKAGPEAAQHRPRQNVVMEMGMLLASLTRKRVAILVKGHLEQPSHAQGIIYFHFNDHVKEVVPKLVERLRQAGFKITPEQISKAQA